MSRIEQKTRKKNVDFEIQGQFCNKFFTCISIKSKMKNSSVIVTGKLLFPPCTAVAMFTRSIRFPRGFVLRKQKLRK